MTAILNIGLNVGNNKEEVEQLNRTLVLVAKYEIIFNLKLSKSTGDWGEERTLVIEIENSMGESYFKTLLKEFCKQLEQDAIAYKTSGGKGGIVYNADYEGEIFEFNEEYFVNF